jgi:hypothetical protein
MNTNDLIADAISGDARVLGWHLNDLTDQDMLTRPVPSANHPAWQLGHLIVAETNAVNLVKPGAMPELPAGFADRFKKDTARSDNAADFVNKAELLQLFEKTRRATVAWVKTLSPRDYATPTPDKIRGWAPTVGILPIALAGHVAMHVGQIQVLRRKLGKPVLF